MTATTASRPFQAYVKVGQGWRSKSTPSIVIRVEEMTGQGCIRAAVAQHADSHEVGADRHMTQSALKANYDFEAETLASPIAVAAPVLARTTVHATTAVDRFTADRLAALAQLGILVSREAGQAPRFHLADSSTGVWCNRPVLGQELLRAFPSRIGAYLCTACGWANHADGGQPWSGMRSLVLLAEAILSAEPAQLREGWQLVNHDRRTFSPVTIVEADTNGGVFVRLGHAAADALARQTLAYGSRDFEVNPHYLGFEVPAGYIKR